MSGCNRQPAVGERPKSNSENDTENGRQFEFHLSSNPSRKTISAVFIQVNKKQ